MDITNEQQLTCRQWKLNPNGCLLGPNECQFAHRETGVISPPSTITCWAWKHGGCKYVDEACLFAHRDTGIVETNAFSARHRPMRAKDRAIGKAAVVAGFDPSDIDRLMSLINAVRNADSGTDYPDYYRGTSNLPSSFPPARFRHGKAGLRSYRDLDNPAVPAYTFTSDQLINGMRRFGNSNDFMGFMGNHVVESAQNQTNIYNKRISKNQHWARAEKRAKNSSNQQTVTTSHITIDLTQDELPYDGPSFNAAPLLAENAHVHPSRRTMVPGASQRTRGMDTVPQSKANSSQRRTEDHHSAPHPPTTHTLNEISNTLSGLIAQLSRAREDLRRRWDEDRYLQKQTVTDDLASLNSCFSKMEEAGRDSLDIIQGRLIK